MPEAPEWRESICPRGRARVRHPLPGGRIGAAFPDSEQSDRETRIFQAEEDGGGQEERVRFLVKTEQLGLPCCSQA